MPDNWITFFDYSRHPITDIGKTRLIEYHEDAHLAVFEYDGINGSKNVTDNFSGAEQRKLKKNIRSYLDQ